MTDRIAILVFDGVEELDAIGPFEVFSIARAAGADIEARLVTSDEAEEVYAAHGLVFRPQGILDDSFDVLVVPGGGWSNHAPRGTRQLAEESNVPRQLASLHGPGGPVLASVCTGAMLLAAAGCMKERRATTHAGAVDDLVACGAEFVNARVVDDGDLVSAGGVTAGIDLALHLVQRLAGPSIRASVEREIEYVGESAATR
jgi:transcriptional regulator GlxA family with amidase domain